MSHLPFNTTDILIVGNPTHDVIVQKDGSKYEGLGGAVSYAASVVKGLKQNFRAVTKVGGDFKYLDQCSFAPEKIVNFQTTCFINHDLQNGRVFSVPAQCSPIFPDDIYHRAHIALACGVIGEVLAETLARLRQQSKILIGDIQGLIRRLNSSGEVVHTDIKSTPFHVSMHLFDFLKVNEEELPFIDINLHREKTTILVTRGEDGCTVYEQKSEYHVQTPPRPSIDSTGAGDCFLAGFASGLNRGLTTREAVNLGNTCGGLATQTMGVPKFEVFRV